MKRHNESTILRLERAGGALAEAEQHARQSTLDPRLLDRIARVNRAVADLRRAAVMIDGGPPSNADDAIRLLDLRLRDVTS